MREYKISDIENLEQYVYDTIVEQFKETQEEIKKMGFSIKSELVHISEENESLIKFTVRKGKETFSFSLCYIAKGKQGGYYVSPLIKEGTFISDAVLLLQQVKTTLLEKGFDEAKEVFDGLLKDCYKMNFSVVKILKALKITGLILAVAVFSAIIALLIVVI